MRFLCLHGMGTNGKIFEVQTSRIRLSLGDDHEYVFIDGAVTAPAAPGVKQITSNNDQFLRFANENDIESVKELYHNLLAFIESEGPFDGFLAFSEGAGVAASLLAHQELHKATEDCPSVRMWCGIFFCGADAFDVDALWRGTLQELYPMDGHPITLPTTHIWAKTDAIHPEFGQKLQALCADGTAESYVHDLGHTVPGAQSEEGVVETVRAIRRTIERAAELEKSVNCKY